MEYIIGSEYFYLKNGKIKVKVVRHILDCIECVTQSGEKVFIYPNDFDKLIVINDDFGDLNKLHIIKLLRKYNFSLGYFKGDLKNGKFQFYVDVIGQKYKKMVCKWECNDNVTIITITDIQTGNKDIYKIEKQDITFADIVDKCNLFAYSSERKIMEKFVLTLEQFEFLLEKQGDYSDTGIGFDKIKKDEVIKYNKNINDILDKTSYKIYEVIKKYFVCDDFSSDAGIKAILKLQKQMYESSESGSDMEKTGDGKLGPNTLYKLFTLGKINQEALNYIYRAISEKTTDPNAKAKWDKNKKVAEVLAKNPASTTPVKDSTTDLTADINILLEIFPFVENKKQGYLGQMKYIVNYFYNNSISENEKNELSKALSDKKMTLELLLSMKKAMETDFVCNNVKFKNSSFLETLCDLYQSYTDYITFKNIDIIKNNINNPEIKQMIDVIKNDMTINDKERALMKLEK